ncbi:MAG: hypothetical protein E7478_07515 [Ruminococcaceae bacterium]|nr:hypothetical protein [Oscillospiraceae bacterium]
MCNNDEARKLAEMLDKLCSNGSQHINVTREADKASDDDFDIKEKTHNSTDCCKGDLACNIPTLHKGIDDEED